MRLTECLYVCLYVCLADRRGERFRLQQARLMERRGQEDLTCPWGLKSRSENSYFRPKLSAHKHLVLWHRASVWDVHCLCERFFVRVNTWVCVRLLVCVFAVMWEGSRWPIVCVCVRESVNCCEPSHGPVFSWDKCMLCGCTVQFLCVCVCVCVCVKGVKNRVCKRKSSS